MNKVILMGRLTRDPEVRYTGSGNLAVARYTLAVDRRYKRDGEQTADFISCVSFGKTAEFCEKYFHQGIKIAVTGRIQTGSYTNRDGQKVYTTEVVVEEQEFAESRSASAANRGGNGGYRDNNSFGGNSGYRENSRPVSDPADASAAPAPESASADGFMNIPDGIEEELPFV